MRMVMLVPMWWGLLITPCDLLAGESDKEMTVFDSLQTQERVGERPHIFGCAAEHDHLHAIVMADVDVEHGDDQLMMVVLKPAHFIGQITGMMIINERQTAQHICAFRLFFEPRLNERIPHQIAQRFGTSRIALLGNRAVEALQQVIIGADAETRYVSHLFLRLRLWLHLYNTISDFVIHKFSRSKTYR